MISALHPLYTYVILTHHPIDLHIITIDQEDVWLYENWFYGMTNGVIMESGALNGVLFSNSLMFEAFANWTSINVEADPENYANLVVNRERGINVNGALCSEPKLLHYSSVGVGKITLQCMY